MQPEIDIGGLELKTFGMCFALAFVAAAALIGRRLKELDRSVDWAYEIMFAAMAGGLVGARLYWLVQNPEAFTELDGLFGGSGLVWYGGLMGGAAGVCLWAWRKGMLDMGLTDLVAPSLALGYAIGRIGCQLSGDGDYGEPSDLPWAMSYPDGVVPTTDRVHPAPVYETLAMGLAAWVLWRLRFSFRPGLLFALYLMLAGTSRFLVEFIRRNDPELLGLTTAQLLSLGMVAVGAAWWARAVRGGGVRVRRAPAATRAEPAKA